MSSEYPKEYCLIFEGPLDDSADTLRSLKACFLADLELEIADIQRALNEAPVAIMRSSSRQDLDTLCAKLVRAGGLAHVKSLESVDNAKSADQDNPIQDNDEAETEQSSATGVLTASVKDEIDTDGEADPSSDDESNQELTFILDLEDLGEEPISHKEPLVKEKSVTWAIDLPPELEAAIADEDDSADTTDNSNEAEENLDTLAELIPETLTPAPPSYSFLLDGGDDGEHDDGGHLNNGSSETIANTTTPVDDTHEDESAGLQTQDSSPALALVLDDTSKSEEELDLTITNTNLTDRIPAHQKSSSPPPPAASNKSEWDLGDAPLDISLGSSSETTRSSDSSSSKSANVELVGGTTYQKVAHPEDDPEVEEEDESFPDFCSPSDKSTQTLASLMKKRRGIGSSSPDANTNEGEVQDVAADEDDWRKTRPSLLPNRSAKGTKLSASYLNALLAILVCGIGVTAWWANPLNDHISAILNTSHQNEAKESIAVATSTKLEHKPLAIMSGEVQQHDFTFKGRCLEFEKGETTCSVTIITPAPRELTPEEIVTQKVKPPWLRRLELNSDAQMRPSEDGYLEARGQARVFVEYKEQRGRIAANFLMKLIKKNAEKSTLSLSAATQGTPKADSPLLFEARQDGRFSLRFAYEIPMQREPYSNSPEGQVEGRENAKERELEEHDWDLAL